MVVEVSLLLKREQSQLLSWIRDKNNDVQGLRATGNRNDGLKIKDFAEHRQCLSSLSETASIPFPLIHLTFRSPSLKCDISNNFIRTNF